MRLPLIEKDENTADLRKQNEIDYEKSKSLFKLAYDNGVNYFDTAWPYHGGKSEIILGKALKELKIRDKVYIADKCPVWLIKDEDDWEHYIDMQLEKLDTDHIDFYLLHAMNAERWQTVQKFNGLKHLEKAKADGRIHHIGFSFHDNHEVFKQIVDGYDKWEFCQLMINLIDTHADIEKGFNEAGLTNLEYAEKHELGVIAMEPLRGGIIANPSEIVKSLFAESGIPRFASEWGLRWVLNHQDIICTLSGMNEKMHVLVNSASVSAAHANSLLDKELTACKKVGEWYRQKMLVPCTGCSYCMPCPSGVKIPAIFKEYNRLSMIGAFETTEGMPSDKKIYSIAYKKIQLESNGADQCIQCGKCEQSCPQHIPIRNMLKTVHAKLM
jgi:predicted aldo/keto reductase-like oxidoreductase